MGGEKLLVERSTLLSACCKGFTPRIHPGGDCCMCYPMSVFFRVSSCMEDADPRFLKICSVPRVWDT